MMAVSVDAARVVVGVAPQGGGVTRMRQQVKIVSSAERRKMRPARPAVQVAVIVAQQANVPRSKRAPRGYGAYVARGERQQVSLSAQCREEERSPLRMVACALRERQCFFKR